MTTGQWVCRVGLEAETEPSCDQSSGLVELCACSKSCRGSFLPLRRVGGRRLFCSHGRSHRVYEQPLLYEQHSPWPWRSFPRNRPQIPPHPLPRSRNMVGLWPLPEGTYVATVLWNQSSRGMSLHTTSKLQRGLTTAWPFNRLQTRHGRVYPFPMPLSNPTLRTRRLCLPWPFLDDVTSLPLTPPPACTCKPCWPTTKTWLSTRFSVLSRHRSTGKQRPSPKGAA